MAPAQVTIEVSSVADKIQLEPIMNEYNANSLLIRAHTLVAAGRLNEAREIARAACEADPDNVNCWLLLGNISGLAQTFNDAIQCFQHAIELDLKDHRPYLGMTNALYAVGRLDDAVSFCRKALEIQPDDPSSWNLLATIYGLLGNLEDSAACFSRVLEQDPANAQAHRSLGYIHQSRNDLKHALEHYRRAVEYDPNFADAHNDIGVVLQEQGQVNEAIAHFRTALRIRPDFTDALMNLGNALMTQYDIEGAQQCFESILSMDKDNPKALCGLGSTQLERGLTEQAYENLNRALSIDPSYEDATVKIARLHERRGEYDEALHLLQPIIDRGENANAIAAFGLLSMHLHKEDSAIDMMQRALKKGNMLTAQRIEIHFTLGRLYDRKGNYDLAFHNFEAGNKLKPVNYPLSDHRRLIDSLISTYSEENLPLLSSNTPTERQPIFIVGMPRSGTSLVEQILSIHPQVQAAGELTLLNRVAAHMHVSHETERPYPEGALTLTKQHICALSREYLDKLPIEEEPKRFFTDKMPHNFLHLGLIQQMFPTARIVHCIRDPRDTCFSCYSYDFNGEHSYAYDLEALGQYHSHYRRLMRHWQAVLSIPILNLSYEQVISSPEQEIRHLIEFCGLEWDDRCLDFHSSRRFVLTSSYHQVRRPIYSSSVGRWKNYEKHIRPLLDALEPGI